MTISSEDAASVLERYRIHFGVGLLLVIAVGLMVLRPGGADDLRSSEQKAVLPPMPATKFAIVENEVIEQAEVDYDASLKLSAAVAAR